MTMPKYEVRERPWPDSFKRRHWPKFWRRVGLKRPWGLFKNGLIIGMYETKTEAEEMKVAVESIEANKRRGDSHA